MILGSLWIQKCAVVSKATEMGKALGYLHG